MATWNEFEQQSPELAAGGQQLMYQYGPGLGYLATIRPDGGPRVHPFCPIVCDGELWAFVLRDSPKGRDLARDGRYALHAFSPADVDDEFYASGTVELLASADETLRTRVAAATLASVGAATEDLFRMDVERALLSRYEYRGQWPPAYTIWIEGQGTKTR